MTKKKIGDEVNDRMNSSTLGFGTSVKYKLRNLSALYARTIGTLGRTLELEGNTTDGHLAHTFLAEVAEFGAI